MESECLALLSSTGIVPERRQLRQERQVYYLPRDDTNNSRPQLPASDPAVLYSVCLKVLKLLPPIANHADASSRHGG